MLTATGRYVYGSDSEFVTASHVCVSNNQLKVGLLSWFRHETSGGSLDTSFRLLAIFSMLQSHALAFFRAKMKMVSACNQNGGKIANSQKAGI